jgi:hypothetical protein
MRLQQELATDGEVLHGTGRQHQVSHTYYFWLSWASFRVGGQGGKVGLCGTFDGQDYACYHSQGFLYCMTRPKLFLACTVNVYIHFITRSSYAFLD